MIRNCREFEERIQQLMDERIDPETDQAICAHTSVCSDCRDSMMAFSIMHTNYLNDSDSMKIKLEHLGLHEILAKKSDKKNHKHLFAIAASIAALVVLFAALSTSQFFQGSNASVAQVSALDITQARDSYELNFDQLQQLKRSIESNEFIQYTSELPGFRPFQALSIYLDWVQKSLFEYTQVEDVKEDSPLRFDIGNQFSCNPKLLCCS